MTAVDPGTDGDPTARQRRLLRAGLLDGDAAIGAWEAWLASGELDDIDGGSYRLLPLVWHNLARLGYGGDEAGRLRGIARHQWVRSQMLLASLAEALSALGDADVQAMAIKGAPLALQAYPTPSLRPMVDVDVLVRRADVARAGEVLVGLGYEPLTPFFADDLRGVMATRHAASFGRADGREVDLHWELLPDGRDGLARWMWEGAEPLVVNGVTTAAPCPTDQLLHACVHGMRFDAVAPLRWVSDATYLLGRAADAEPGSARPIAWERLVAVAQVCRIAPAVGDALRLWAEILDDPTTVPDGVVAELTAAPHGPTGRLDAWEYRARRHPPADHGFAVTTALLARIGWRANRRDGGIGPVRFLRHTWGVPPDERFDQAVVDRVRRKADQRSRR